MNHINDRAKTIKQDAIIADLALGFEPEIEVPRKWEFLNRYKQAGITFVGLALAGEFTSLDRAVRYISQHRTKIRQQSDDYLMVENVEDIETAKKANKLALGLWLQGTNPLGNDISMIETYYKLGIRYALLVYNTRNAIGDGVIEKSDAGLSQFGHQVIKEMNRVGMLIDLSHAGLKTSLEAIEASKDPVIFSHSNADSVVSHVRNLKNEQIKAVAEKNGVIGMNSVALFLNGNRSTGERICEHIDYVADLLGTINHIALGLDMVYFYDILDSFYQNTGGTYPKGYLGEIDSFTPEKIDELIEALIKRNYTDDEIQKMLGQNFIRVAKDVWK